MRERCRGGSCRIRPAELIGFSLILPSIYGTFSALWVKGLLPLLSDEDPCVRVIAVRTLGQLVAEE